MVPEARPRLSQKWDWRRVNPLIHQGVTISLLAERREQTRTPWSEDGHGLWRNPGRFQTMDQLRASVSGSRHIPRRNIVIDLTIRECLLESSDPIGSYVL